MSRVPLALKAVGETRTEVFSFLSLLAVGETLSGASTTVTVYSGTDASPSSIISGSATISGSNVSQKFTGGVSGVTYLITVTALTSAGQTLTITAYLPVL